MFNKITELPDDAIVFDTETTGFDPESGDRIVEIGAVRMLDGLPTKDKFHVYVNPGRSVPQAAVDVHGLTAEFLTAYDPFEFIAQGFLDFVGDLPLVAHNAAFDAKFINHELMAIGLAPYAENRFYDSLAVARRLYPGATANLDALCRRHNISLDGRDKHGALLDSELLADVIVEMGGGRQTTLFQTMTTKQSKASRTSTRTATADTFVSLPSDEDLLRHSGLVEKLGEKAIWHKLAI